MWVLLLDTIVTVFTWLLVMFREVLTELHLRNRLLKQFRTLMSLSHSSSYLCCCLRVFGKEA